MKKIVKPSLTAMTPQRAREIWEQRDITNSIPEGAMTDEERAIVEERWKQLPGESCWMDAFFTFLYPKLPRTCRSYPEIRAAWAHRHLSQAA